MIIRSFYDLLPPSVEFKLVPFAYGLKINVIFLNLLISRLFGTSHHDARLCNQLRERFPIQNAIREWLMLYIVITF